MGEAFHHGGWGMYPTAIAALFLVVAAARYTMSPDRRRLRLVRHLAWLAFLVGSLGTVTGMIKTFMTAGQGDFSTGDFNKIIITGIGESMNCVAFGLCAVVLGLLITAFGLAKPQAAPDDTHGV